MNDKKMRAVPKGIAPVFKSFDELETHLKNKTGGKMSKEFEAIEKEIAEVTKKFDVLNKEKEGLLERRRQFLSGVDRRISEIDVELLRLQGENTALRRIMGQEPDGTPKQAVKEEPKLKIPKTAN